MHPGSAPRIGLSCWTDTRGPLHLISWNLHPNREGGVYWSEREKAVQRFSLIEECHSVHEAQNEIKFKMQMLRNIGVFCMGTTFRGAPYTPHTESALSPHSATPASKHKSSVSLLIPKKRKKTLMLYSLSLMWKMDTDTPHTSGSSDSDRSPEESGSASRTEINRILALCDVLKSQLQQVSGVLRDLLSDNPSHLTNDAHPIHAHLREFLRKVHLLSHTPGISQKRISLDQTIFAKSPAYPMDFIARVITCHLQMHGKTVVVGHDCDEINRWISTLTLFVLPQDTKLCRYAQPTVVPPSSPSVESSPKSVGTITTGSSPDSTTTTSFSIPTHDLSNPIPIPEYIPELWVQGLHLHDSFKVNNATLSLIFSPHKVMQSPYPFCIVDIVNRQVKTLYKYDQLMAWKSHFRETQSDEYRLIVSSTNQRKAMLKKHKSRAFNLPLQFPITPTFSRKRSISDGGGASSSATLPLPESSDFKFHVSTDICTSVTNLFDQSKALPSYMRKGWICEYMRNIQRKAILLTKMLEQYLVVNPNPSPTEKIQVQDLVFDWIHDMDKFFSSEERKKSLSDRDEIQMEILVAQAQRMTSHEIYSFMRGDTYGNSIEFMKWIDSVV